MSSSLSGAVRGIESLVDRVGRLTAWIALAMISLVAINVLLRYSLSLGSVWAQELEWHLLAALILLGMGHALQRGENVRVDLFYARFGRVPKFVVDVISLTLLIVMGLLFIVLALPYIQQAYVIAETSQDPGGIPYRWVVKALIPLGYALLVLQAVGELVRTVLAFRAGATLPSGAGDA
jgi:TRAP-type mannitol/chloroaromatic compound transport system permease small subunit